MKLGLLVLTMGKQEGKLLEVKLPQFLIGRDPQCQLRPASPMISKRHCAILQRDGKAFIRDFGSTNGTYLNDQRVEGEAELQNDDQLKVGPILFAVRLEADAPAAPKNATPVPATKQPAPLASTKTPPPPTRPSAKTGLASNDTPLPGTAKVDRPAAKGERAAATGVGDDVDISAMLLDLDDGDSPTPAHTDESGIPDGSTVMDLRIPPEVLAAAAEKKEGGKPAAKSTSGDTRSAAAKILEQMTKRPRN